VQHLDLAPIARNPLGERAGAVGRVVVDDQDPVFARNQALKLRGGGVEDPLDVGHLVVCGDHHPDRGAHRSGSVVTGTGCGARGLRALSGSGASA
jgi:hypothetical protein